MELNGLDNCGQPTRGNVSYDASGLQDGHAAEHLSKRWNVGLPGNATHHAQDGIIQDWTSYINRLKYACRVLTERANYIEKDPMPASAPSFPLLHAVGSGT